MINKQNLWFITLFSLILVLSIYYVTMSDDTLATLANDAAASTDATTVEVSKSNVLVALRVEDEEAVLKEMDELQTILLDDTATLEEKNDAYDALQALNSTKGEVEKLQNLITEKFKYDNFVKINGDVISVIISAKEHNEKIANNIIRAIQNEYDKQKYITVKFES